MTAKSNPSHSNRAPPMTAEYGKQNYLNEGQQFTTLNAWRWHL